MSRARISLYNDVLTLVTILYFNEEKRLYFWKRNRDKKNLNLLTISFFRCSNRSFQLRNRSTIGACLFDELYEFSGIKADENVELSPLDEATVEELRPLPGR